MNSQELPRFDQWVKFTISDVRTLQTLTQAEGAVWLALRLLLRGRPGWLLVASEVQRFLAQNAEIDLHLGTIRRAIGKCIDLGLVRREMQSGERRAYFLPEHDRKSAENEAGASTEKQTFQGVEKPKTPEIPARKNGAASTGSRLTLDHCDQPPLDHSDQPPSIAAITHRERVRERGERSPLPPTGGMEVEVLQEWTAVHRALNRQAPSISQVRRALATLQSVRGMSATAAAASLLRWTRKDEALSTLRSAVCPLLVAASRDPSELDELRERSRREFPTYEAPVQIVTADEMAADLARLFGGEQ